MFDNFKFKYEHKVSTDLELIMKEHIVKIRNLNSDICLSIEG